MRSVAPWLAACLLIALAPHASAAAVDPLAALPWQPSLSSEDRDDDGYEETQVQWLAFGPCGCYCPVAGGEVELEAAGQKVTILGATALVFCGVLVTGELDEDQRDLAAEPSVGYRLIMYGPVLDDVEPTLELP